MNALFSLPPPSRLEGVDAFDAHIILILARNGYRKASIKQTAQGIGRSNSATNKRLSSLEARQIVQRFEEEPLLPHLRPRYLYQLSFQLTQEEIAHLEGIVASSVKATVLPQAKEADLASQVQDKPLVELIGEIGPLHRLNYLKLLTMIDEAGEATMQGLADKSGELRQTIHSRLDRWLKLCVVRRERRIANGNSEFVYYLAPNIKGSEIRELVKIYDEKQAGGVMNNGPVSKPQPSKEAADDKTTQLLAKLPDFDPSWPAERQDRWFAIFERLALESNQEKGKTP